MLALIGSFALCPYIYWAICHVLYYKNKQTKNKNKQTKRNDGNDDSVNQCDEYDSNIMMMMMMMMMTIIIVLAMMILIESLHSQNRMKMMRTIK